VVNFIDRIRKPAPLTGKDIAEAPALYNRATRRAFGLFGRFWRWDLNASDDTRRTYVPRYIRRHFNVAVPRTRRQRRVQARILRITREKGLV
jgi:hypothetical protein